MDFFCAVKCHAYGTDSLKRKKSYRNRRNRLTRAQRGLTMAILEILQVQEYFTDQK
jgi:hypothetical protein